MKNIRIFLSENFLVVKFSVYFNRHVFVMGLGSFLFVYALRAFCQNMTILVFETTGFKITRAQLFKASLA